MGLINQILCLVQGFIDSLFGLLNSTLGLELAVPDIGCVVEDDEMM